MKALSISDDLRVISPRAETDSSVLGEEGARIAADVRNVNVREARNDRDAAESAFAQFEEDCADLREAHDADLRLKAAHDARKLEALEARFIGRSRNRAIERPRAQDDRTDLDAQLHQRVLPQNESRHSGDDERRDRQGERRSRAPRPPLGPRRDPKPIDARSIPVMNRILTPYPVRSPVSGSVVVE
ncbi:MAG: hypothetical protein IPK13_19645 [Deltaproteobacteria bacterium]|nr:hypothetical protein [Deltaproteobacteria bacterium]